MATVYLAWMQYIFDILLAIYGLYNQESVQCCMNMYIHYPLADPWVRVLSQGAVPGLGGSPCPLCTALAGQLSIRRTLGNITLGDRNYNHVWIYIELHEKFTFHCQGTIPVLSKMMSILIWWGQVYWTGAFVSKWIWICEFYQNWDQ